MRRNNFLKEFYKLYEEHESLLKKVDNKQQKINMDHKKQLELFKKAQSNFKTNN